MKGKIVPVLNSAPRHEGIRGSGGIVPRILNVDIKWRRVVTFKHRPLYQKGKSLRYPLNMNTDIFWRETHTNCSVKRTIT
jgi:hypothetical protein